MDDLHRYKAFAEKLADLARPIARRYFRSDLKVIDKPDATPVTLADMEIEARLREEIVKTYPSHGIVGEEEDPTNIDAEYVWVIDPIDGTKAFTVGKPQFGTLVGLCRNGEPIVGVIDQAITDERWVGVMGEGAWFNGSPMRARAKAKSLADAIVLCTTPDMFVKDAAQSLFAQIKRASKGIYYGGDCYNFALVAQGNADLVIECGLKTVDFAALVNPIAEAGGIVCDWRGRALGLSSDGTIIAAANRALADEALRLIETSGAA
jgi:inositol-phosphate phosphatase / L-galactose 1-phosphate phosphatase / histidinol-phosphatase